METTDTGAPINVTTEDWFELNRAGWDRRATAHFDSRFYDVPGFLGGASSLCEIELGELHPKAGDRLLHLQCHFGLDTLSWAREGLDCTGVDLSPVAIDLARKLSAQSGIPARFICANVLDYERDDAEPYDIVFTSYGAVCWLPDLARWASVISSSLASGGTFYMAEFHPAIDLVSGYGYFNRGLPDVEDEGSYTENGADARARLAVWVHPMADVCNALISAGIVVEQLNEFPFSPWNCFEGLVEREPGRYYLDHQGHDVPLVYSIRGRKQ